MSIIEAQIEIAEVPRPLLARDIPSGHTWFEPAGHPRGGLNIGAPSWRCREARWCNNLSSLRYIVDSEADILPTVRQHRPSGSRMSRPSTRPWSKRARTSKSAPERSRGATTRATLALCSRRFAEHRQVTLCRPVSPTLCAATRCTVRSDSPGVSHAFTLRTLVAPLHRLTPSCLYSALDSLINRSSGSPQIAPAFSLKPPTISSSSPRCSTP